MNAENSSELRPYQSQDSPPGFKRSRWRAFFAWALLLSYAAFIDLTLSSVPTWREELSKRYGDGAFTTITYAAAVILLTIILAVMIFRNREKKPWAYISLVAILLFLRHVMRHWMTIPSEQIHFVEYGIMGFLAYHALRHHLKGWGLVVAALLIVALCLPLQGYFNSAIAQFGVLVKDEAHGVIFRSRLKPAVLRQYNHNLEEFKRKIAAQIGKARMAKLLPGVHDKIHEEALVHAFRRWVYHRNGNYLVAYKETLILEGYYQQFIQGTDLDWAESRLAEMRTMIGDSALSIYESPVAEHLITKFNALQMWATIILLEAGIVALLVKLNRHNRSHSALGFSSSPSRNSS